MYQLYITVLIFLNKFVQKGVFPVKNKKFEHQHLILHTRISVGTKFQFKLTNLIFFEQICPKRVFPVEN